MDHLEHQNSDREIDLGVASVETKGPMEPTVEIDIGQISGALAE